MKKIVIIYTDLEGKNQHLYVGTSNMKKFVGINLIDTDDE